MATATEVMKNFFKVLKKYSQETYTMHSALDEATRAVVLNANEFKELPLRLRAGLFNEDTPELSEMDSATRLQTLTGMVIGDDGDLTIDTGAISGSNAGGDTVKDAQSIVPEDGDLSTATLPEAGSTTQITYTGDDGKSFTFNVKWPDSFTQFTSGRAVDDETDVSERLKDSRFVVDLNDFDENRAFKEDHNDLDLYGAFNYGDTTYGEMKTAAKTILKGLNTYWLKEGAKLIYDSYGLDFDGKTIEIKFMAGGNYVGASAITVSDRDNGQVADHIIIGLNLASYGKIDETNPNGLKTFALFHDGDIYSNEYLDRIVAHEMVHAAMMASGTLKGYGIPHFFGEGVADLVQGDNDYNSESTDKIRKLISDSDTFIASTNLEESGGGNDYPAGVMVLRFMALQAKDTTIFVGDDSTHGQTINLTDNDSIITDYDESNTINYNADFLTAYVDSNSDNDFWIATGKDNLMVFREVRGKLMSFSTAYGDAYAYMAKESTELDGRNFKDGNKYEIIFGSNYENDVIRAGNGGSQLWGGYLGNDELYGGAGVDTFIYDVNGGNDTVHDAESQDIVLLRNVDLSQISSAQITDNGVNLSFTYGGSLNVSGQVSKFVLEDSATTYIADYQNKTWRFNEEN